MILNLNPIFLPSLVFFKRENIINISYDFLSPINNNKNDLSIKNILKNVTFSENKSFYFLKTNKFMVESVINIKKNNNNYIWIINEFHIKINEFNNMVISLEKLFSIAATNGAYKIFITIEENKFKYIKMLNDLDFHLNDEKLSLIKKTSTFKNKFNFDNLRNINSSDQFNIYQMLNKKNNVNFSKELPINFNQWIKDQKIKKDISKVMIFEENSEIKSFLEITNKDNIHYVNFIFFTNNKEKIIEIINTTITKLKMSTCYTIISSKNETLFNCFINEGFQMNKKFQTLYKNIKSPIKLEKKYYKKDLKIGVPN
tara:strand:- start:9107 stop:10048 length:942 start_codon:yes stop_codon:yes gene_type:complete